MFDDRIKTKTGSQQLIKETNIRRVFKLVSLSDGISRAELANRTGLSPTTISSLADELISAGFILEAGPGDIPTSGRKPIMLKVNPRGGCIIAVDLREDGYFLEVFNLDGTSALSNFINITDFTRLGKSLIEKTADAVMAAGYKKENLLGICIGAPGIIDRSKGVIVSSTIIPINKKNNFYKEVCEAYPSTPVELMNESSLSAYAEKEFSKATKDINNLIYIDIHTGIGAGIIINGMMYEGSGSLAGEFGHISVDINGPLCKCGGRGCLETLASIPALIADIEKDSGFPKKYPYAGSSLDKFAVIADEYRSKGTFSNEIEEMAKYIAYGINNAINLLNPGAVIIGGKAAELGDGFLKEIKRTIKMIGLEGNRNTRILLSEFKGNPVTSGGAKHIFNTIF